MTHDIFIGYNTLGDLLRQVQDQPVYAFKWEHQQPLSAPSIWYVTCYTEVSCISADRRVHYWRVKLGGYQRWADMELEEKAQKIHDLAGQGWDLLRKHLESCEGLQVTEALVDRPKETNWLLGSHSDIMRFDKESFTYQPVDPT